MASVATQLPGIWEGSWLFYSIAAVVIALIIQITIYTIARSFNLQELERNTKAEMMQVGATFILAVFLVTIVGSLSDYVNQQIYGVIQCGGETITISSTATTLAIMQCKIIEKARALEEIHYAVRDEINADYYIFSSSLSIMGVPVFSGQYLSGLYKTIESYRYKNNLTITLLIALNALITFVALVGSSMLTLFLPLGVLLRAFYFTRGIGSLLIAIAIGFYFIFPYLFIITDPGFVKLSKPEVSLQLSYATNFCVPTFSSVISMTNFRESDPARATAQSSLMETDLARIYASLIIHPLVVLFLTIIAIRYLIYLFGEESYDLLRMTMRLV